MSTEEQHKDDDRFRLVRKCLLSSSSHALLMSNDSAGQPIPGSQDEKSPQGKSSPRSWPG